MRLYDRECDRLDQICNDVKVPWSCVYLMDGTLWSGPLVIPGFGPCYRCFRRRYLTHANGADREIGLMRAYMKNPDWGPSGFLSPMVWMAASILMTDAQVKTEQAGKIRRFDFFDGSVVDTKVIAVHNCVRCRPQLLMIGRTDLLSTFYPAFKRYGMIPNNSALKAESIGQIFADDPNITLPRLPRILPEIQVIPQGVSGLLFVGTIEPQLIKEDQLERHFLKSSKTKWQEDDGGSGVELPFLSRKSLVNVVSSIQLWFA